MSPMLDHVSITASDIVAAERFYDAIMAALEVVKVGRRDDWLGYGERARPDHPDRVYLSIRKGAKPGRTDGTGASRRARARWSTRSGPPASPPAAAMTVRRACAIITRLIMARSSAIPTAIVSRRSVITLNRRGTI